MLMATRQKQELSLNLNFVTTPIEQVSKHCVFGVTVDEQLKWETHINSICRTVSRKKEKSSFKTKPNCQPSCRIRLFPCTHLSHINYVSNAWDGCVRVHMKQLYSLQKRAITFLMPNPNMDYSQKCCALKLLPLDKQLLLSKCVLMQNVVYSKAPQYL